MGYHDIYHEEMGEGDSLVMVHGAWADGRHWIRLAVELADEFRAIEYDRRGHGRSAGGHEGITRDVDDLVDVIDIFGGPVHVVGGSFGGCVALRLAGVRPDLVRSLAVHEPALAGLLGGAPPRPEHVPTPEEFAESSLGENAWEWLTEGEREGFRENGDVWQVEMGDADAFSFDPDSLTAFDRPLLVTVGGASPPHWRQIAETIPGASIETVPGAGHLPHLTHAREYAGLLREFASAAAAPR